MKVGLENLIAPELAEYLDEVREFNAAAEARGGYWAEPDVLTPEGLREAREGLSERPGAGGAAAGWACPEGGGAGRGQAGRRRLSRSPRRRGAGFRFACSSPRAGRRGASSSRSTAAAST